MPFSSSPDVDDGSGMDSAPGTCIGGSTQDAGRQMQVDALRAARAKEEAQAAALESARARAEQHEQELAEERAERQSRERCEAREAFYSTLSWGFGIVAFVGFAYMAQDAYRNQPTASE